MFPVEQTQNTAINAGSVRVEESRAVAEARGQMQLAKMFPRDLNAAHAELMESCSIPALANAAFYTVPRGGSSVSGPSIRLAEEIARVCGNIDYGHRELSRDNGKSEVEVYAWDKQTNTRSIRQITVMHVIDTKNGSKPCTSQTDIDNLIANKASKQLRGRLLALAPKWLVESAIEKCRQTLAGNTEKPLSVRVREMTQAFARFGVSAQMIEGYLGHGLDETLVDELTDMVGIYNALKDGASPRDYFQPTREEREQAPEAFAAMNAAIAAPAEPTPQEPAKPARQTRAKKEPEQAAPTPAPTPEPEATSTPAIDLEQVVAAIAQASTLDQLGDAAKLAAQLSTDADKAEAREAYALQKQVLEAAANKAAQPEPNDEQDELF